MLLPFLSFSAPLDYNLIVTLIIIKAAGYIVLAMPGMCILRLSLAILIIRL